MAANQNKKSESRKIIGIIVAIIVVLAIAFFAVSLINSQESSENSTGSIDADKKGQVLSDGDLMKVTYESLTDGESKTAILSLEIENKSDQDVSATTKADSFTVNGVNITPLGEIEIPAGKEATAQFTLNLERANISSTDKINDIAMTLQLTTLSSPENVVTSAPINITY